MITHKNIIIIGMPGSGKSSVAKVLSQKIKWEFLDTDSFIEDMEGYSVENIFKNKGENYFRERERDLIINFSNLDHTVISTGGGMPVFYDNMANLKKIGITFFLEVPLKEIVNRLERPKNRNRPLIKQGKSVEDKVQEIYNQRIHIYEQADLSISCENKNKYQISDEIIKMLQK